MTPEELQKASNAEIQRGRAMDVSGDDCETEYKTNAEVCVKITGGDIECHESYDGNYYNDCDVTIRYEVETNYKGGTYINTEVECKVDIQYKGTHTYITQSDSGYQSESFDLYANDSRNETMYFNFSFSSFEEITSAEIDTKTCEIESVELY